MGMGCTSLDFHSCAPLSSFRLCPGDSDHLCPSGLSLLSPHLVEPGPGMDPTPLPPLKLPQSRKLTISVSHLSWVTILRPDIQGLENHYFVHLMCLLLFQRRRGNPVPVTPSFPEAGEIMFELGPSPLQCMLHPTTLKPQAETDCF